MVTGVVGLTLGGVDDDGIHLAQARCDLHVSGEGGAAQAHHPGVFDDLHQLLGRQVLRMLYGLHRGVQGVLVVVLNHHAEDVGTVEVGPGLHRHHLAGDTGMDGGADIGGHLPDLLSHIHMVPHRHAGPAGGPDVQGHGDHHLGRWRQGLNGLLVGRGLFVVGMDPPEERLCHILFHLFFQRTAPWAGAAVRIGFHLKLSINIHQIPQSVQRFLQENALIFWHICVFIHNRCIFSPFSFALRLRLCRKQRLRTILFRRRCFLNGLP